MARIIKVKNNKVTDDTWVGQTIVAAAEHTLAEIDFVKWSENTKVLTDVATGDLGVSNGTAYFATASERIDWLKGNKNEISNLPIGTTTGGVKTTTFKPELFSTTVVSHDWTDRTTWYQNSVRVTDEVLTTSDNLTYSSVHTFWIDLTHGKMYDEDTFAGAHSVIVKVADVVVTTGFTVNYAAGTVVFVSDPGAEVKATYSYSTISTWIIAPAAGKKIMIEHVELQVAKNVQMNGQYIDFEIWVYNPANLPNKFMYQRSRYKNMRDIINAANLGQGFIPAIGTLTQDIVVFPFNYASLKALKSSQGAEVRIRLSGDQPLGGEWGTCTFYIYVDTDT